MIPDEIGEGPERYTWWEAVGTLGGVLAAFLLFLCVWPFWRVRDAMARRRDERARQRRIREKTAVVEAWERGEIPTDQARAEVARIDGGRL